MNPMETQYFIFHYIRWKYMAHSFLFIVGTKKYILVSQHPGVEALKDFGALGYTPQSISIINGISLASCSYRKISIITAMDFCKIGYFLHFHEIPSSKIKYIIILPLYYRSRLYSQYFFEKFPNKPKFLTCT